MSGKEINYIAYIKSEYPQIDMIKIDFHFNEDPYNDIVVINDESIFQFSKYDWTVAYLENEVNSISFLKDYIKIRLPEMERLKKGAVKYNLIQGVPLSREKLLLLGNKEQDDIARQIGFFLKEMHSIPMKAYKNSKLSDSPVTRTTDDWLAEYAQIQQKVYPYCDSCTKDSIDHIFQPLSEDGSFLEYRSALIHAALIPRYIIFDEKYKRINGITGFGLSGIGDPAYDLSVLLNHFGETFMKKVGRYYHLQDDLVNRARFYALADRMSWMKKTADMITTRDFTNFQYGLNEGDVMPIGSRW